jgi:hypothetical protein
MELLINFLRQRGNFFSSKNISYGRFPINNDRDLKRGIIISLQNRFYMRQHFICQLGIAFYFTDIHG